jgi:act minimal PKS chain-length factor (CLF/KS beta)
MNTRTVITGMGVVAPTGMSPTEHWKSVVAGRSGIRPISRFDAAAYPVRVAGQVPEFRGADYLPGKLVPQTDIGTQMGLAAAAAALEDAGIVPNEFPEYGLSVVTASSSGGTEFGQHEMERLYQNGPEWVGAYQSIAWFYAATTGQISIRHGMRGSSLVVCQEQAGGLDAIAHARKLVLSGSRAVVVGGSDASLCPYGLAAQLSSGWLSTSSSYRPFAPDANGYVPGEGGAMLIAEPLSAARERGAKVHATVLGHAAGFDPAPWTGRPSALRRTIEAALADAGIGPSDVDVVFADGAAVPERDAEEAAAISAVFGSVPVTVPKMLTGRMYAGGGALDVVTAVLAMRHDLIPHVPGIRPGHDIDLVVDGPRPTPVRTSLLLARGHGGFVSALVLTKEES